MSIFQQVCCNHNESKTILSIEQISSILSFVNIGIYFISTCLYYNQIVVTFRLGTRLSSSNQISVLNTPLYCRKVTIVKQQYCKYYCIPFIYIYILLLLNICINTHPHQHTGQRFLRIKTPWIQWSPPDPLTLSTLESSFNKKLFQ